MPSGPARLSSIVQQIAAAPTQCYAWRVELHPDNDGLFLMSHFRCSVSIMAQWHARNRISNSESFSAAEGMALLQDSGICTVILEQVLANDFRASSSPRILLDTVGTAVICTPSVKELSTTSLDMLHGLTFLWVHSKLATFMSPNK